MPRKIPQYQLHKATGQGKVRINGRDHYLGPHNSEESLEAYHRLINDLVLDREPASTIKLTSLLAAWWIYCKRRYRKGKGKLGGAQNWRSLIRMLRVNFGDQPAEDLSPKRLRHLIEREGIANDWTRRYANKCLERTKQIYRWAVGEELVSIHASQRIDAARPFRQGDTRLRESAPVEAVPDSLVDASLAVLTPLLADMVQVQRLTGMRPGELVGMHVGDIDRSADVWVADLAEHKTRHRGKRRRIYFGPRAQAIILPYLVKQAERHVFEYRPGCGYTSDSYRTAIQRKTDEAGLARWSPNQLRHAAATQIRSEIDLEHAQAILGHSRPDTTTIYAQRDERRAIEAAKKLG